jgi:hypothetical protein
MHHPMENLHPSLQLRLDLLLIFNVAQQVLLNIIIDSRRDPKFKFQNADLKSDVDILDSNLSTEIERVGNISNETKSAKDFASGKLSENDS